MKTAEDEDTIETLNLQCDFVTVKNTLTRLTMPKR